MFKLDLEKAEEPEIKLSIFVGSRTKQGSYRKTSTSALLTTLNPLTVWITTNWKVLKVMGISDHLPCLLRYLLVSKKQQLELVMEQVPKLSVLKLGKEYKVVYCLLAL